MECEGNFAKSLEDLLKTVKRNNGIEVCGSDVLYHYTNLDGLRGIVGNNNEGGLWFTRYDCLNDKSEGQDFGEMYDRVLDKLMSERLNTDLIKRIKEYKEDNFYFFQNRLMFRESGDYYICCFCDNDDNLPMWNYYGNNGYSIGITKLSIESVFRMSAFPTGDKVVPRLNNICRVIYDEDKKCDIIEQFIRGIVDIYNTSSLPAERKWDIIQSKLSSFIGYFRLIFKNKNYKYENEIRAIVTVPKNRNEEASYEILGEKKYRERAGVLVPYFDCRGCYHIRSINIAPRNISDNERRRNESILEDYLLTKGRNNIGVTTSKIPVRF